MEAVEQRHPTGLGGKIFRRRPLGYGGTSRATALLPLGRVVAVVTARCGDCRSAPPCPRPKFLVAAPFPILKRSLMFNTPESITTAPPKIVPEATPVECGPGIDTDSPTIICDLTDSDAFVEQYRKPHVPGMFSFGAGGLHACRTAGRSLCKKTFDPFIVLSKNAHYTE